MSLSKYLLIGALGAGAIGGILWLSKEGETVKFDSKLHTLEKLHDILEDTFLEYACSYIFFYNILLNLKDQKQYNEEVLQSILARVSQYTKERDITICKRFGITPDLLEVWTRKYADDKKVSQILKDIQDLHDQAIIKQNIKELHFGIPEKFTREIYLQIARKVQACLRHEAYIQVQALLKVSGKDAITNEEMDEILDKIGFEKQEKFRIAAMKLYGIEVPAGEVPKRFL